MCQLRPSTRVLGRLLRKNSRIFFLLTDINLLVANSVPRWMRISFCVICSTEVNLITLGYMESNNNKASTCTGGAKLIDIRKNVDICRPHFSPTAFSVFANSTRWLALLCLYCLYCFFFYLLLFSSSSLRCYGNFHLFVNNERRSLAPFLFLL